MLIKDIPRIMLICLISTIIIELFPAYLLNVRRFKDLINVVLVNMITNPLVVIVPIIVGYRFNQTYHDIGLVFLEILAVLTEGFFYKKYISYKKINPFVLSFVLNVLSYFIGSIYWRLI